MYNSRAPRDAASMTLNLPVLYFTHNLIKGNNEGIEMTENMLENESSGRNMVYLIIYINKK